MTTQEDDNRGTPGSAGGDPEHDRSTDPGAPPSPDPSDGWAAPGQGTPPPETGPSAPRTEPPTSEAGPSQSGGRPGFAPPERPARIGGDQGVPAGYAPPGSGTHTPPPGGMPPAGPGQGWQGYPPPGHGYPGQGWQGQNTPRPPKPGVVALRPMTLGDLLNGAFALVRSNPRTTVGLSLMVMAVTSIVTSLGFGGAMADYGVFVDQALNDPASFGLEDPVPVSVWSTVATYGGSLVSHAGTILVTGLLTAVVGMAVLGRKLSPSQAWAAIRDRIWIIVGLAFTQLLIALGLTLVVAVLAIGGVLLGAALAASGAEGAGIGIVLASLVAGFGGGFALLIWISIRVYFAMPVVVLERLGVFAALGRSWRLTRGSWWRVFGIVLLTSLLIGLVGGLLTAPFSGASVVALFLFPTEGWMPVATGVVMYVGEVLVNSFTTPFTVGVTTLLYVDLRMRREGLDLRLHSAAQAGHEVGPEIYLPERRA